MLSCESASAHDTMEIGRRLGRLAQAGDVVVLTGDLGAGKTQFSKGFAAGLGVDDEVTSPTFTIMVEYVGDELPLLHFDLYRLESVEALEDIDYFGMLESGAVCLVEWGDKFPEALPEDYLEVSFSLHVRAGGSAPAAAANTAAPGSAPAPDDASAGAGAAFNAPSAALRRIEVTGLGPRASALESAFADAVS